VLIAKVASFVGRTPFLAACRGYLLSVFVVLSVWQNKISSSPTPFVVINIRVQYMVNKHAHKLQPCSMQAYNARMSSEMVFSVHLLLVNILAVR